MAVETLKPNDRYALVGKTRSGKTREAMVLAGSFAMAFKEPWEVWWLDTKNDPDDLKALRKWGFRNYMSESDRTETGGLTQALYYLIKPIESEGEDSVKVQAQKIIRNAYNRGHVLLVIDEYTQVVMSKQSPGAALSDVFARGGGKNVGIIGLTQEPVFIPRQLLSQATHLVMFNLTYQADIDYIKKLYRGYIEPVKRGDPHGFYWKWVDGTSLEVNYYKNQAQWYDGLRVLVDK